MKQPLLYIFKRFLAYSIDFVLLVSFVMTTQWGLYFLTGFPSDTYLKTGLQIYSWVVFAISLPIYAYFIILEKEKGQTLGKKLFKLTVTDIKKNKPITWSQAFIRTCIKIAIPWELTHIAMLFPTPILFLPAGTTSPLMP